MFVSEQCKVVKLGKRGFSVIFVPQHSKVVKLDKRGISVIFVYEQSNLVKLDKRGISVIFVFQQYIVVKLGKRGISVTELQHLISVVFSLYSFLQRIHIFFSKFHFFILYHYSPKYSFYMELDWY